MDEIAKARTLVPTEEVGLGHTLRAEIAPDPLIGTVLDDRYRVIARLGEGGMGLVYDAEHRFLKTRVAIKLLRSESATNEESLERLKREAQSASAIGNQHIVDVRDFGRLPDGTTYVAMERIEGEELLKAIRREPFSWERARHIALQVCEALGAAHERGIVHRDLKPENVLLTVKNGAADFVKVVDFGIAKMEGSAKITMAGRVMGTPEYMSPEQCAGVAVDHRTDLYALGVLLYEMVTGTLPFYDKDLVALVRMHLSQAPVPPSQVRPEAELPLAFEAIVLRLLAKDPRKRFASMDEVAAALRAVDGPSASADATTSSDADASGDDDVPVVPASRTDPALADRPQAKRAGLVIAAVGALAGLGAGAWFLGAAAEPETPSPRALAPVEIVAPEEVGEVALAAPTGPAAVVAPDTAPRAVARSETIEVDSLPPGATVYQDGALIGQTPLAVPRPSEDERLTLTLALDGYDGAEVTLGALTQDRITSTLSPRVRRPRGEAAPAVRAPAEDPPGTRPTKQAPAPEPHREWRDPWSSD